MSTKRIDTWVWVFIFLGMMVLGIGLSVQRSDAALGWGIAAAGITLSAIGIVLVWIRSRMKDDTP